MVILLIVAASAIWVLMDAKSIGVRKGLIVGLGDMGPWGWFVATLGLWIIAFPSYLFYRGRFKSAILTPITAAPRVRAESGPSGSLSGWAIAAFYIGLFSFFMIPAPIAVICGIMAIRDIRANPSKNGKGRAIFGIVAGSLMMTLFLSGSSSICTRPIADSEYVRQSKRRDLARSARPRYDRWIYSGEPTSAIYSSTASYRS